MIATTHVIEMCNFARQTQFRFSTSQRPIDRVSAFLLLKGLKLLSLRGGWVFVPFRPPLPLSILWRPSCRPAPPSTFCLSSRPGRYGLRDLPVGLEACCAVLSLESLILLDDIDEEFLLRLATGAGRLCLSSYESLELADMLLVLGLSRRRAPLALLLRERMLCDLLRLRPRSMGL